jgi:hypothetical protein
MQLTEQIVVQKIQANATVSQLNRTPSSECEYPIRSIVDLALARPRVRDQ